MSSRFPRTIVTTGVIVVGLAGPAAAVTQHRLQGPTLQGPSRRAGAVGQVAPSPGGGAPTNAGWALFEGKRIDLARGWGAAHACWVRESGPTLCYQSETVMTKAMGVSLPTGPTSGGTTAPTGGVAGGPTPPVSGPTTGPANGTTGPTSGGATSGGASGPTNGTTGPTSGGASGPTNGTTGPTSGGSGGGPATGGTPTNRPTSGGTTAQLSRGATRPQIFLPSDQTCNGGGTLFLFQNSNFGGNVLGISVVNTWVNLADYGFADQMSSWINASGCTGIGEHWLGGDSYAMWAWDWSSFVGWWWNDWVDWVDLQQ